MHNVNSMLGGDWLTVLEGYTPRTRQYRKIGNQVLNARIVEDKYLEIIEDETLAMVQRVLDRPNELMDALR